MVTVENVVGRLVEVRMRTPTNVAEIVRMAQQVATIVLAKKTIVAATDLRGATVFPLDLADQIADFLRRDNPNLERNGFLIGDSAVLTLQLDRVLREAGNPRRRSFRVAADLEAWLAPSLDAAEKRRLSEFLADPPSSP